MQHNEGLFFFFFLYTQSTIYREDRKTVGPHVQAMIADIKLVDNSANKSLWTKLVFRICQKHFFLKSWREGASTKMRCTDSKYELVTTLHPFVLYIPLKL